MLIIIFAPLLILLDTFIERLGHYTIVGSLVILNLSIEVTWTIANGICILCNKLYLIEIGLVSLFLYLLSHSFTL